MLRGNIDFASTQQISGWVQDELQPDTPVNLLITNNEQFVARVLANHFRIDLKEAGIGGGRHAFELEFSGMLAPDELNVIRVRRESDGEELPGSPVTLHASCAFDQTAREHVARVLHQSGTTADLSSKIDFLVDQIETLLQEQANAESMRVDRERHRRYLQRWGRELPTGEVAPKAVRRALVIDDRLPKGDRDAGSVAILSHIQSLQRLGFDVTVAPAIDTNPAAEDRAVLEATGVTCCLPPYYGSIEELLRRQAHEFDLIYLHRVSNASKYGELAREYCPKARRIYSVADLHHVRLSRQAVIEDRPELAALSKRVRLTEFAAAALSNAVITHSKNETDLLKASVPGASVFTLPWSVKPRPTEVPFLARHGFAFVGNFGHAPNLDAARWLINDIIPLVRSRDSSIECFLVGSDMPDEFRQIVTAEIIPIGHVASLTEIFDRVRLTVAPLAYGAGVKGKVIESLSAGIPCVCTPIAAEGLDLPFVLRAHINEHADAIAASIVRLHTDETENESCRRAGLEFIREEYSEERLDAAMRRVTGLV